MLQKLLKSGLLKSDFLKYDAFIVVTVLCEKINSFNVGIFPYSLCDKGMFYTLCCFLANQFYQICFLNRSQIEKSSLVASLTFSILISLLVVALSVFHTWTTFLPLGFTFVSITNFWQKQILFPQFVIFIEINLHVPYATLYH